MPVKRRLGKERVGDVPEGMWCEMMEEPLPKGINGMERWLIQCNRERAPFSSVPRRLRDYWDLHRDEVLAEWTHDRPGARPRCWWDWDAPREPMGTRPQLWDDGTKCLARRHVGGGAPEFMPSDHNAYMLRGVPVSWGRWWHEYKADPFERPVTIPPPPAWQPAPLFESQATYLRRLGLLLPGELRRLTARDFEPEAVIQSV